VGAELVDRVSGYVGDAVDHDVADAVLVDETQQFACWTGPPPPPWWSSPGQSSL
jgi:hypothetical protein